MKRMLLGSAALVAIIAIAVLIQNFVWFRAFGASATFNGSPAKQILIYSHGQDVLVSGIPDSFGTYLIRRQFNIIGLPNVFPCKFRWAAIATRNPVLVVDLRSAKADNQQLNLVLTAHTITFLDTAGHPVSISF